MKMIIARAADALLAGGVITYPTEGVFGLGCMPDDTDALQRLLRIKQSGKLETVLQGLATPRDPAFDNDGNLYVAETDEGRILKLLGDF